MAKLLLVCLLLSSFALLASSLPLNFERIKVWGGTQDIFVALGVSVGNPHSITYNLTLDFDNGQTVLIGVNSTRPQCVFSKRNSFDLRRSTTFRQIKQDRFITAPYMYGRFCYAFQPSDGAADVTFGRDDFQLVDGVFHGVPFGVLTAFNGSWSPDWPSDGVLGFSNHPAYRNLSAARTLAILGGGQSCGPSLQSQYLCNSATISLNGRRTPGMHAGDITFGQIPDYCGTVQEADPAGPSQSWSFNVQSAQFGALSDQDHGGKAYLQWSSSDLVEMPQALLDAMMRQVGARKNATTGIYYVDCGRAEELPPFKLYLNAAKVLELKFRPAQYVQQIPKAKQCPVLLRGTTGPIWTFGNRLAEAYCVLMNFTNQKLGFAAR